MGERSLESCLGRSVADSAGLVPILGKNERPSWLANAIHAVLDRVPVERYPCLQVQRYPRRLPHARRLTAAPRIHIRHMGARRGKAIRELVRPGWVAVDVRAHIGYHALILAHLVTPEGHVFAFEPVASNFHTLEENIRLNQIPNVEAINQAAFDRSGLSN